MANWQQGQRFVNRYVEHTALANPHATIHYARPVGAAQRANADRPGNETLTFPRAAAELPKEAAEIKPHPHGVELGALMLLARESKSRDVRGFLQSTFSRVSAQAASDILAKVPWGKKPVRPRVLGDNRTMAEELHKAIAATKLMSPPTNCLSPIGDELMRKGLVSFLHVIESEGESADENTQLDLDSAGMKATRKGKAKAPAKQVDGTPPRRPSPTRPAEEGVEKIKGHNYFIATVTRPPKVYRGNPFQVEVGLAYGGSWPPDKSIELFRFANRVPLLFQRGACGITEAVVRTDWRNYQLSQPKGSLPVGPMALLVHIASRLGAVHQRVEGGGRPLPGHPQGDPARGAGVRPQARHLHPQEEGRRLPGAAPQHLRAVHRGGRGRDREDHRAASPGRSSGSSCRSPTR